MRFQEPDLTCHVAFQDKSGINPFYNVKKKNVNSIQEIIVVVIAPSCWMCGLYFVRAAFDSYATLIADEIRVLLYARYYGVFEMINGDKMAHSGSSRVQKNEIFQN